MTIPLIVLAALATVIGLPPIEEGLMGFFGIHKAGGISPMTYATSALVLAIGLGVSYLFFISRRASPISVRERLRPLHKLVENRYYIDDIYVIIFVKGSALLARFFGKYIERGIIDGVNYALARLFVAFVNLVRYIQTGSSNINVSGIAIGVVILLIILLARLFGIA